jgi:hypothetical protein
MRLPAAALPLLALATIASAAVRRRAVGRAGRVGEVLLSERAASALGVAAGDTLEASGDAAFPASERYVVKAVYRPQADPVEVGRDSRFGASTSTISSGSPGRGSRAARGRAPEGSARAAQVRDRCSARASASTPTRARSSPSALPERSR